MAADIWLTIHAERHALAADLAGLTDERWAQPSMCVGWSVQDVLGHMTATAGLSQAGFAAAMAGSGFRFHRMSAKAVARETAVSPAATLAAFTARADSSTHPPGPVDTWLLETVVHSTDIRRPLGIVHEFSPATLTQVAGFGTRSNMLIGAKGRVEGLGLRATDVDWAAGSGPAVSGPLLSLVMAMTGRAAALDDLSGPGVSTMRERMP